MAVTKRSFYVVLAEAIADLEEHGFDNQDRLERWLLQLEQAARGSLVPEYVLVNALRDTLQRVYARATRDGALVRTHPGVSQFTLAQVQHKLRAELDRRILASAQLIKLNREASIRRTLQRFAGWATSIPAGGTEVAKRGKVSQEVRRGIAGLPFEERRVVIDQGHKLAAALNDIIATDGGAIAAQWRHVPEGPPAYDARPAHVARDGEWFLVRDSWALREGLLKRTEVQYTDQVEAPGEFVYCRCSYRYAYNLRDVPEELLTARGRAELERVAS